MCGQMCMLRSDVRRKEMGGGAYLRVVGVVPTALVEEETMLFFSLGDARIVV